MFTVCHISTTLAFSRRSMAVSAYSMRLPVAGMPPLSRVRATVGDPRRYPGPFRNLLLNSHLQVWKRPAKLSDPRELPPQVGVAIERRSRVGVMAIARAIELVKTGDISTPLLDDH